MIAMKNSPEMEKFRISECQSIRKFWIEIHFKCISNCTHSESEDTGPENDPSRSLKKIAKAVCQREASTANASRTAHTAGCDGEIMIQNARFQRK